MEALRSVGSSRLLASMESKMDICRSSSAISSSTSASCISDGVCAVLLCPSGLLLPSEAAIAAFNCSSSVMSDTTLGRLVEGVFWLDLVSKNSVTIKDIGVSVMCVCTALGK